MMQVFFGMTRTSAFIGRWIVCPSCFPQKIEQLSAFL